MTAAFDFKALSVDQLLMVHNECAQRLGMAIAIGVWDRRVAEKDTARVLSMVMPDKRPWPFREFPEPVAAREASRPSSSQRRGVTLGDDEEEPPPPPQPASARPAARKKAAASSKPGKPAKATREKIKAKVQARPVRKTGR